VGGVERELSDVRIEPWGEGDLALLRGLVGDPAMMEHLGGPESEAKVAERQTRYAQAGSNQFKVVAGGEEAGWVGYWEREWRDEDVFEIGWSVVPEFQGRGIAGAATRGALDAARAERDRRFVHAYPGVENGPSNSLCRKVGFELLGAHEFEYPPGSGTMMRCNDWRFDLFG
jgi:RimJ/RimL family protein N-acetyltransferase